MEERRVPAPPAAPHDWLNQLSCVLVVYVEPVLCCVGFVLNAASVAVFLGVSSNNYFKKTSLLLYLIALSVCNALQLLLSIFVIILPAAEQFIAVNYPHEADRLKEVNAVTVRVCYPLLLAANYAAIWVLTLVCAQRFQAICHPSSPWKQRLAIVRRSGAAICVVIVAALGLNVIRYWELDSDVGSTNLRNHIIYKIVQEGLIYGLIVYGLPIACLIWLNLNIIHIVHSHSSPAPADSRRSAEYRTALMVVFVFILFFLCTTLAATIRLVMILAGEVFSATDFMWLVDLSNLLMNLNAVVSPIICFAFTRGFRDLFFVIRFAPGGKSSLDFIPSYEPVVVACNGEVDHV